MIFPFSHRRSFRFPRVLCCLCVLLFTACISENAFAQTIGPETSRNSFSAYLENDAFAGGDGQYTSGLKLTWSRFGLSDFPEDDRLHKWLYPVVRFLGIRKEPEQKAEFALTTSVVQNIYTPEDIETEELVEDDRPYAGITYLELGYHLKRDLNMDTLAFYGGIVGPHSYAEQVQSVFHDAVNGIDPKGWDNQLDDEPVFGVVYEFKKKVHAAGIAPGMGHDMIFNTGGALGNAHTYYNIGGTFRWGWNLPDDFGTFPIRPASIFNPASNEKSIRLSPEPLFGVHLFIAADGRAVIHNILLDGNTFTDSHSVNKKPIVGYFMGGVGVIYGNIKTSIAYIYQSREFDEQDEPQVYGSLNFSIVY